MKKIIGITGIYGHVGTALTLEILSKGEYEVRGLALPQEKASLPLADDERIKIYRGDVTDTESMRSFFEHGEDEELYIVHCAGIISIFAKFQQKLYDTNVIGTKNVLALAKEYHVKRFIYLSSCDALDVKKKPIVMKEQTEFHPEGLKSAYAIAKAETGNYLLTEKDNIDIIIIHPTAVIGPYDTGKNLIVGLIRKYARRGWSLGATGGFDFVDVRDVALGIMSSLTNGKSGECYILGNRYCKVREILSLERKIGHLRCPALIIPLWIARIFAPLFEFYYLKAHKQPLFTPYALFTIAHNANYSHEKATLELGYHSRPLEETMRDMLAYLKTLDH